MNLGNHEETFTRRVPLELQALDSQNIPPIMEDEATIVLLPTRAQLPQPQRHQRPLPRGRALYHHYHLHHIRILLF